LKGVEHEMLTPPTVAVIGTAGGMFIILIIVCALLPGDNAAYEGRWEKPVNDRQSKILQSLEENFK